MFPIVYFQNLVHVIRSVAFLLSWNEIELVRCFRRTDCDCYSCYYCWKTVRPILSYHAYCYCRWNLGTSADSRD